jgi:hypothetical protein
MGTARWSDEDWTDYTKKIEDKPREQVFEQKKIHKDLDPLYINFRESVDSEKNPNSTPIIIAVDETGSMGKLAEVLIRKGLGIVIKEIYERKPVSDPHVMCMAFGDAFSDRSPLQVTQFEADIRLADQLTQFHIEENGGSNNGEHYNFPWLFAATRTRCDSFLKRNKKGYLFTVGDEPVHPKLLRQHISKFMGEEIEGDLSTEDLLTMVQKTWEVFHIMIEDGYYFRKNADKVVNSWRELLGERAIRLSDHTKLSEVIVSAIQVVEGEDVSKVAGSWSGSTSLVVHKAINGLTTTKSKNEPKRITRL